MTDLDLTFGCCFLAYNREEVNDSSFVLSFALKRRQVSNPFISGIIMSNKITSGNTIAAFSKASGPVAANSNLFLLSYSGLYGIVTIRLQKF